jgi:predicted ATP-dependent protease
MLYYLLADLDPDFPELFKVAADFSDEVVRSDENHRLYANLVATVARREDLRPLNRAAVAAVVEHAARMVGDSERLTAQIQGIVDLLQEANYWADEGAAEVIDAAHVQQAIASQIFRLDRVAQLMKEEVLRKTIHVQTVGSVAGQINGLSVLQLGSFSFGQASRITATVKTGRGDVLSIDREVNMSGPIHNKGVLILASFLNARYALDRPLALSASVVFEQSYGGVEGDSASSTELYVLLSALADVPLRQGLAVTGSVDQYGRVQAIGGVNEKIEGFFDLCHARGLTGDQGVLIPASNAKHLMLRQDVVDAVAAGKFHVYPVEHVDEGIELLTGLPAGERDKRGHYPHGTFNRHVEDRLLAMARRRLAFEQREKGRAERAAKRAKPDANEKEQGAGRSDDEEQAKSVVGDAPKAQES